MRIRKADSNQSSLVKQIRKIPGVTVRHTHTVGQGFPDLAIGFRGKTILLEVKDPANIPSKRRLTEDEQDFFNNWTGEAYVVETFDDVLKILNV